MESNALQLIYVLPLKLYSTILWVPFSESKTLNVGLNTRSITVNRSPGLVHTGFSSKVCCKFGIWEETFIFKQRILQVWNAEKILRLVTKALFSHWQHWKKRTFPFPTLYYTKHSQKPPVTKEIDTEKHFLYYETDNTTSYTKVQGHLNVAIWT